MPLPDTLIAMSLNTSRTLLSFALTLCFAHTHAADIAAVAKGVAPINSSNVLTAAPLDVKTAMAWIKSQGDNKDLPYAIIDKRGARLYVFDGRGALKGNSPVLLGLAQGDDSVPGIGDRPIQSIRPEERTTPAGRFITEPGVNTGGEDIVWIDYDAAVSMHRVRTANKKDRRLERLASATVADNRISYGCVNMPAAFYDSVVKPLFGSSSGVVYVLPETRPLATIISGRRSSS